MKRLFLLDVCKEQKSDFKKVIIGFELKFTLSTFSRHQSNILIVIFAEKKSEIASGVFIFKYSNIHSRLNLTFKAGGQIMERGFNAKVCK